MKENDFLEQFDSLLKLHKIDDAKEFGLTALSQALNDKDTSLIITILNELIGFYRDLCLYDESIKLALSLANVIKPIDNPYLHFISNINIGNAYRAASYYEEAHNAFNKALTIYENNHLDNKKELAALYNNLALLNQAQENYLEAINNLKNAINIIGKEDKIKLATSYVNMAQCHIKLNNLDEALTILNQAKSIFINNLNDFHIMGYYSTMAKLLFIMNDYVNSEEYYLKALVSIDKNIGRASLYQDTMKEYQELLSRLNKQRMSGLCLAQSYFNDNKDIIFLNVSEDAKNKITIGLFGLGSECYGMDDYISEDHDFNPGFVVLCENDIDVDDYNQLIQNYENLPKEYNRFYIRNILPKHGVHMVKDYLYEYIGIEDESRLTEQNKSLLTNGKIFYSGYLSSFVKRRKEIIKEAKHEYLRNIALKTLEISQYIPYNLKRALDRNENDTYLLLKNHLIDKLIEYYYLYHHEFLPHDKLQLKMMNKESLIYKWIMSILKDEIDEIEINKCLVLELYKLHIIDKVESLYIDDYRDKIISFVKEDIYKSKIIPKMIEIEWNMFQELENIGGRASCQNNKPMFILMRESQYYAWNIELLESYYNDLKIALEEKYNLLAIKYGFMEETVDPAHFQIIKDGLPTLSEKRISLREGIVSVQLEMLNEYSKEHDISNMRTINTSSDKYNNASYETYLRGELSSYSEKTMYLYASYLANLSSKKINLVELTLFYTKLFE